MQVIGHLDHRIQSHDIGSPERSRFRTANNGTGEFVHLIDSQSQFLHRSDHLHDAKDAYSVRDERRRVLAKHGSLAEVEVAIPHKETDNLRIGMCGGYDLKQFEIARRVKEVCAAE